MQLNREPGMAGWESLCRGASTPQAATMVEEKATEDILCTPCEHLHLAWEGRLCRFPMGLWCGPLYGQLMSHIDSGLYTLRDSCAPHDWEHLAKETCWFP